MRVPGSRSPSRDTAQVLHPLGLAHHDQEDDDDGGGHDGTIGGNEEDDKDDCVPRDHFRCSLLVLHHTRPPAEDDNGNDDHHDGNHDDDELRSCFKQFSVPDGVPDIVLPELYVQSTIWGEGANGEEVAKVVLAIPQALSCQVLCAGRKGRMAQMGGSEPKVALPLATTPANSNVFFPMKY